jgi:hypothetical protein
VTELSTDYLLFGVVIAIGVNRVFQASGFRLSRVAYVVVQAVNMSFVLGLWTFKISEFADTPRAELGIRVFLMCFVAWHMVRNSQSRAKALRQRQEEAEFVADRRARIEAFNATQAEPLGTLEASAELEDEVER